MSEKKKKLLRMSDQAKAKLDWVRKVVRQAREVAWVNDMSKDELRALAKGLVDGFDGDGTQEPIDPEVQKVIAEIDAKIAQVSANA